MRYIFNTPIHPTPPVQALQQAPDIDTCCEDDLLSEETIAKRAYFNYLATGASNGHDVRDWLDAESRLRIDSWSVPSTSESNNKP